MRNFLLVAFLCCQLLTVSAANVPLMPVRDLRVGMQGIGKTVISGDNIENFNVEILGVTGTEASGYSIFVRLYGDLIEKTGGVAQGMSGSPVYIDGRLVGAVAFGKAFNDPHYCFLTPIGSMLRLLDEPYKLSADWIPKGTALSACGFTDYGLTYLQEKIKPFGLTAVGSGGVGLSSDKPLEPGSAVGAAIMHGDMNLGALGTVTWTDDHGNVLAFGHSFMQRGNSNFFMNKAWVLGVIPNLQSSYKVGNLGEPVGTFTQDRASGIGGSIGKQPDTIPLFVTVNDSGRGLANSTRVRIIEDEQLLPSIVDAAVVNTLSKTVDRNGGGTARLHFKITAVDSKKEMLLIDRDNMFYSSDALLKNLNQELTEALSVLMQNKIDAVQVYGIDVTADVTDIVQVTEISNAAVKQKKIKPGDKIAVEVFMKPYRGEEFSQTVYFKVPKDHPGGKLVLNVRGGSSIKWALDLLRKQQAEGVPAAKKKDTRQNLGDFVKSVNNADKNNELIIDVATGQLKMNPETMADSDAGIAGILQGSPFKQKYPFDFIIDGEAELVLDIE